MTAAPRPRRAPGGLPRPADPGAVARLDATLDRAEAGGHPVPCRGRANRRWWTSEQADERAAAALACALCPALTPCAAVGAHEVAGVWAGWDAATVAGRRRLRALAAAEGSAGAT